MSARAALKRDAKYAASDAKRAKISPGRFPIELLPPELLNEVLDWAPEAVPHLHQVIFLLLLFIIKV